MTKVLLYTSIFGPYDELCEIPVQTVASHAKCYSDEDFNSASWQIEKRALKFGEDPILTARYHKIGQAIADYDFCVYLDGSFKITRPDFLEFMLTNLGRYQIAFMIHPDRQCVYDEAEICQTIPKCDPPAVREQITKYAKLGMPRNFGLWAAPCFAFRNTDVASEFRLAWWQELSENSKRDQISLPYVIWQKNFRHNITTIKHDIFQSPYARWLGHRI